MRFRSFCFRILTNFILRKYSIMIKHFLLFAGLLFSMQVIAQTGIGTVSPHPSAKLEVNATDKGFLPPRMTSAQRIAISSPAVGLMVYQTDGTSGLYYYGSSGWVYIINSNNNVLPVANGGTGVNSSTGTGNVVLSSSPSISLATITSGSDQFPQSINIFPTTHVTSKRAAIWLDGWSILQDVQGNGTKNFSIGETISGPQYPPRLVIAQGNGNIGLGTISPTARLNLVGGGIKIHNGFSRSNSRPSLTTTSIGNYEIRGVGSITGSTQVDGADDGFLRLSAGGGTNTSAQSSIDISGGSDISEMNNNIVMRTSGAERLRINDAGRVGIGTNNPTTALQIENGNSIGSGEPDNNIVPSIYVYNNNNNSSTANSIVAIRTAGTGGGKPYISFDSKGFSGFSMGFNNPTDQFIINTDWNFNTSNSAKNAIIINEASRSRVLIPEQGGAVSTDWPQWGGGLATYDICAASVFASNFVSRSDERLKNSITTISNEKVANFLQLRPVTYYWNQDKPRDPNLQYGLIAQEVEKLFPEIVLTGEDTFHTKSINYQALHALSIKIIQTQQQEIEGLRKKQSDIEARLIKLEAKF